MRENHNARPRCNLPTWTAGRWRRRRMSNCRLLWAASPGAAHGRAAVSERYLGNGGRLLARSAAEFFAPLGLATAPVAKSAAKLFAGVSPGAANFRPSPFHHRHHHNRHNRHPAPGSRRPSRVVRGAGTGFLAASRRDFSNADGRFSGAFLWPVSARGHLRRLRRTLIGCTADRCAVWTRCAARLAWRSRGRVAGTDPLSLRL
jgi:hypothetical protein